jgi:hypothetical protein
MEKLFTPAHASRPIRWTAALLMVLVAAVHLL